MDSKISVYVIGCAFGKDGKPREVDLALRKEFNAVSLQENAWIFSYTGTFEDIRRALGQVLGQGDRFFVLRITKRSEINLFEPNPALDLVLDVLGPRN
jgi:hypothetical protein